MTMKLDVMRTASKVTTLPVLRRMSPTAERMPSREEREAFLACQRLAQRAAMEVASLAQEGWTEKQAANLLTTYLRDCGARSFFHEGFAWFGERTRFTGIHGYRGFMPSGRRLAAGEVFILDVAPIYRGYSSDIGYTTSLGPCPALDKAKVFLAQLRADIPALFNGRRAGEDIWNNVDDKIREAGYDNIHQLYPFSVLGHRVHNHMPGENFRLKFLNFGWQSYWSLMSRGLFGQLLNPRFNGSLAGLWAIEPHIGGAGFGAKFEEILVVPPGGGPAHWLDPSGIESRPEEQE